MKHLPPISFLAIKHKDQRYDTAGDYLKVKKGPWMFLISKMGADYEFLVLIHELIEWYLTQKRGISEKTITDFDMFEVNMKYIKDPGTDPKSPYFKEHKFATRIEKLLAKELGVDWEKYDKSFENLKYPVK